MAEKRILAQVSPSATTSTALYTVPQGKYAVLNCLKITNRSNSSKTFRVSISLLSAALANKDYLYYDLSISGNSYLSDEDFNNLVLEATDIIRIYASSADLSFTLIGTEIGVI